MNWWSEIEVNWKGSETTSFGYIVQKMMTRKQQCFTAMVGRVAGLMAGTLYLLFPFFTRHFNIIVWNSSLLSEFISISIESPWRMSSDITWNVIIKENCKIEMLCHNRQDNEQLMVCGCPLDGRRMSNTAYWPSGGGGGVAQSEWVQTS